MLTALRTRRRLWSLLIGEPEPLVTRSATGRFNEELRAAWSSYFADRALLVITIIWLFLRYNEWQRIALRSEFLYAPRFWLAELVFPTPPTTGLYYLLLIVAGACVGTVFFYPRNIGLRFATLVSVLLVSVPEHGYGHVEHTAHLLLLGHVYSIFRPIEKPDASSDLTSLTRGYSWFLFGLLAVYTASGLWKIVDMTIRDVLKPGVTWLQPEAMLATSIASMRNVDLPMDIPAVVESVAWAFPIGYVLLTIVYVGSFVGAFRRPFLLLVVPTVAAFHLLNAVVIYVLFIITIFVAIAVLTPYDFILPGIRRRLVPISRVVFSGSGYSATFSVQYVDGSTDEFRSFYAYRERLRHQSALLAAPLYYPGVGLVINYILEKLNRRQTPAD